MGENLTTQRYRCPPHPHRRSDSRRRSRCSKLPSPAARARRWISTVNRSGWKLRPEGEAARLHLRRWGMSGFYASVVAPGPVRAGDRYRWSPNWRDL
jgi:MOSC domain-containing protein YiiM